MIMLLLAVNIGVFAVMAIVTGGIEFSAQELLDWGGNYGRLSLHGEPWRLLSSQYLHEGVQHILGNMVLLAITGSFLAKRLGPALFLACYTVCGLAAAVTSAMAQQNVVGIGASGAIAGLVGIVVVFWMSRRYAISGSWVLQTVGLNALYSFAPGVDKYAHLGGFVCGLACGGGLLAVLARPSVDSAAAP